MAEVDTSWFSSGQFLPHGHCYTWSPGVLWLNVVADVLIAMAYFTIPFALLYIARRRRDLRFDWLLVCFGIFVVACGLTHLMAVWNVWHANYWIEGIVKLLTAAASVPTAILLWRFLPSVLMLPSQRQLRDANESLARANRELEAFTASVSHDLRSPLTTIAGQAGLLELSLHDATDEQKRRLSRIQSSVRQMSELIEALLVLSRISRQTLHREIVDVSALAESIVQDMRQKDPTRSVEVLIQPNMAVHGDRRLVGDLFQNLIGNAWKFTSKTGQPRIEIGQSSGGSLATLYIRDNGAGFDMAYEQKLFKPFQRLHGAADFDGSGVGLATVARIIDRHGGRIWAEGKPNEGAVFYFTLPTAPITGEFAVHHHRVLA
ncbi:MAG TPA: ATP-binding protein [Steroidobacteraceae bacterium]|jgi:signal transduction histidine kinase